MPCLSQLSFASPEIRIRFLLFSGFRSWVRPPRLILWGLRIFGLVSYPLDPPTPNSPKASGPALENIVTTNGFVAHIKEGHAICIPTGYICLQMSMGGSGGIRFGIAHTSHTCQAALEQLSLLLRDFPGLQSSAYGSWHKSLTERSVT